MIGIEKIGFYTPNTYLAMTTLAKNRNVDPNKYIIGLGQEEMAVPEVFEDAVTMAANAALGILDEADKQAIDMILVGSESGIDHSKSIAVYVQALVGISKEARAVELKQACYGATAALQLAKGHLLFNQHKKVLVIATDIAKYGLNTPGEATQGAGAVAMLISHQPNIAIIEEQSAYYTQDIMDFWRPVYSDTAFANGKFSTEQYIAFFEQTWQDYTAKTTRHFSDFAALCYHLPFTKLGMKAMQAIIDKETVHPTDKERLLTRYEYSKTYNKRVGNIYTGSLYLSLLSLLETDNTLVGGDRIGLFSYGSGAVGEFFSIVLQENFQKHLNMAQHHQLLNQRRELTIEEYTMLMENTLPKDGSTYKLETQSLDKVVLTGISEHKRLYHSPVMKNKIAQ